MKFDLNCDMGESPDAALEEQLMPYVTSAAIACGEHAGDNATMGRTVRLALQHNVRIGAHPGYADRANFGRVPVAMAPAGIERLIREQVVKLANVARMAGAKIAFVKPHGALYHAAATNGSVARAVATAVRAWDPNAILITMPGTVGWDIYKRMGVPAIAEGYADRRYEPDGSLRARNLPDALITDPFDAALQAAMLVRTGRAQTICVHSDTPGAVEIAKEVRAALEELE